MDGAPTFMSAVIDRIGSIKNKIGQLEAEIGLHEILSRMSKYPEWRVFRERADSSLKVLMKSIMATNTVDVSLDSEGKPLMVYRRVSDDDRREIAADMRAVSSLLDVGEGSEERVNRLKVKLDAAKAHLDSESKPFVGMELEV
jgi:hypothetical protein